MSGATYTGDAPRIGLFGRLGSGNLGNDGSMEVLLDQLRRRHPEARIDAMVSGPDLLRDRYGIPAVQVHRFHRTGRRLPRFLAVPRSALRVGLGLVVDAWRTARWARGHDLVVIPGMGVLESTLPTKPWQMPWSLFVLALAGRLFGAGVAFVSVGASPIADSATAWLILAAARLASYRSFRDEFSRNTLRQHGLDVDRDAVYPDLAFSLTAPDRRVSDGTVGVGVIDFRGTTAEAAHAVEIHERYANTLREFVCWLVASGRPVRLLIGDRDDEPLALRIVDEVRATQAGARIMFNRPETLADVMEQIAQTEIVVASRFHNVLCALVSARPTLAISYGEKHVSLLGGLDVGEYVEPIRTLDVDRLIARFEDLVIHADDVRRRLATGSAVHRTRLAEQFAELDRVLSHTEGGHR